MLSVLTYSYHYSTFLLLFLPSSNSAELFMEHLGTPGSFLIESGVTYISFLLWLIYPPDFHSIPVLQSKLGFLFVEPLCNYVANTLSGVQILKLLLHLSLICNKLKLKMLLFFLTMYYCMLWFS